MTAVESLAKHTARLAITPTTAVVIALSQALPPSCSMWGAPRKISARFGSPRAMARRLRGGRLGSRASYLSAGHSTRREVFLEWGREPGRDPGLADPVLHPSGLGPHRSRRRVADVFQ